MTEESDKGFKVNDRRGYRKDEEGDFVKNESAPPSSGSEALPGSESGGKIPLPPLDFAAFILTLHTNALVHLGMVPNPGSQKTHKDLDLARQTIDLIAMLETKTKGNLDGQEAELVKEVLYSLRMQFVAASKETGAA